MDGKHILIQAPAKTGSMFFNYKKSFSTVLLAIADSRYKFVAVDIGACGKQSDGNVFTHSTFGQRLKSGQLKLPSPKPFRGSTIPVPHVLVADEAFPLKTNLMRPFPGSSLDAKKRIFNYRLSRARRVIENAFGIMASRFRVFRRPITLNPTHVDEVVKASVVLHNYLREKCSPQAIDVSDFDYTESDVTVALQPLTRDGRPSSSEAMEVRSAFVEHLSSLHGSVPWQNDHTLRTY